MAKLTNDNGVTLTPEQIAAAVIADLNTSVMVEINGGVKGQLETVVRYLNKDKIMARGEGWFTKNYNNLSTDAVESLIKTRCKGITDYLAKKEQEDKDKSFRELIAKGQTVPEAYKSIYG